MINAAEPSRFIARIEEGTLSGAVLRDLLQAVLDKGASFRFRAKGYSMTPFVRDGDVVTVAPPAGRSPAFGDVAAFLRPDTGKLVVHRVIGRRGGAFLMRGDSTEETDGYVPAVQVLGRVIRVERRGKRVRLGLGPERFLIAVLTRRGIFHTLLRGLFPVWLLVRPWVKKRGGELFHG